MLLGLASSQETMREVCFNPASQGCLTVWDIYIFFLPSPDFRYFSVCQASPLWTKSFLFECYAFSKTVHLVSRLGS